MKFVAENIEKLVLQAAWTAIKFSNIKYEIYSEWLDDIFQEAQTEYIATGSYTMASNAAAKFLYHQINKGGMTGGSGNSYKDGIKMIYGFLPLCSNDDFIFKEKTFPVLTLCHLFKRLLRKGGKRGRKSVALKALIVRDRITEHLPFNIIASRYDISLESVKRHYRMAFALLISWFYKNMDMMDSEQLKLLSAIKRKPLRNFNSKGQLYNYADR